MDITTAPPTPFAPFAMERWQSLHENRVELNLSESGVHPLTLGELLELGGADDAYETLIGYGQSNGTDELRARIARLYPTATDRHVVVTNGSAEANFLAVWELLRPGDEVAILVPTYMQTHGLATNFGARVVEIPQQAELGWQPDPDTVRTAISDRTRLVVVTNPGNPTGAILGDEARNAIIEAASRTGAWILADEVYTGAELNGDATPSLFGEYERTIATGSLSKAYGLPGLRIGWAVCPPDTAETLWARSDYTTISTGELTDRLARIALDPDVRPRLLERTRDLISRGLEILETWLHETGGFHWRPPVAGAICYARYDAPIASAELAERLRSEQSVLIVPGAHFGMDRWLRFGLGSPGTGLQQALERIGATLRTIS
jgi:aspartate/methionine/tyrosine aminotransferase